MKETKFLAWSDTHVPYHDSKAVICALKVMEWFSPDEVIILGDFLDCSPVNRHERNNLKFREGKTLLADYKVANNLLDVIQQSTNKVTYLQGNHEIWVDKMIDENPELDGLINVEQGLELKARGIKYLPYNVPYKLGKLYFVHGLFTGAHHAQKHVDAFGCSVAYGHLHDVQMHVKVSPVDVEDRHLGISLGCLANKNPQYMKNRPNNWVHAIGIGTVRSDGTFNIEPIIINDGVATISGRTIRWNEKASGKGKRSRA